MRAPLDGFSRNAFGLQSEQPYSTTTALSLSLSLSLSLALANFKTEKKWFKNLQDTDLKFFGWLVLC